MKKIFIALLLACSLFTSSVKAEETNISLKQGFLLTWKDQVVKNLTTLEVSKTSEVEGWGKWNALWSGWSLDIGWAYDNQSVNSGAILIGRDFGVIGKYLPIAFPLKDKISITIYPIGLYAESLFDHPKIQACSGGAIIKFNIKF